MERLVDFLYRQQAPWQHGELSGKSSVRLHGSRHEDGKVGFFCFLLIGDHMFDDRLIFLMNTSWISDEKWDPSWKASKNKTSSYDHWSDSSTYLNLLLPDTLTYLLIRYFNIPLRMKDDPFRLIGVIGSIQVRRLVIGLQNLWSSIPWNRDIVTLFHSVTLFQAQRFVTGALQLYPNHTENLLRSFWMRSWGEKIMNLLLRTSTLKSKYVVFHRWG